MKTKIAEHLLKSLKQVNRPLSFCAHESVPVTLPGLEIQGIGPIGLPISEIQVKKLVGVAHQAPYGKGEETVVDTDVRRVWAIDPDQFSLTNPKWPKFIKKRIKHIKEELGLQGQKLRAHLYQLLLYESGGFFLPHKDGEKLDGMVATMVIGLPSIFEGGELVIRHNGQEEIIDFSGPESAFLIHAASFYADCEHEIKPIQKGVRLVLVYNITLDGSKKPLKAPQYGTQTEQITHLLETWKDKGNPEKFAVLLDHEYTQKGLRPELLKGTDRAKAQALFAAGTKAGCKVHLGLLTLYEAGAAEGDYGYGYYDQGDPEDYTMGEIFDRSLTVKNWVDIHGNSVDFGEISFNEETDIIAEFSLTDVDPEEEFEGYTGNAGMELTRWYRHGAIVLWPETLNFKILCKAGIGSALAGLEQLVSKWKINPEDEGLKRHCVQFTKTILQEWPQRQRGYGYAETKGKTDVVALLGTLDEPELIATYLGDILVKDATETPASSLTKLCKKHGWLKFKEPIKTLLQSTSRETVSRNFSIFEKFCIFKDREEARIALCRESSKIVFQILVKIDEAKGDQVSWQRDPVDRKQVITTLFKSFCSIQKFDLLDELVKHIVKLPDKYDLTTSQLPAIFDLGSWIGDGGGPSIKPYDDWLAICQQELASRTEKEPQPPSDWRRPANLSCSCSDCSELRYFLNNPNESTHRFRMKESRRQHLQTIIERDQCDLTHQTERRGTPYTLVCEKTNSSYDRRLKTYRVDLQNLNKIKSLQRGRKTR